MKLSSRPARARRIQAPRIHSRRRIPFRYHEVAKRLRFESSETEPGNCREEDRTDTTSFWLPRTLPATFQKDQPKDHGRRDKTEAHATHAEILRTGIGRRWW
jgi:hypothetical protein